MIIASINTTLDGYCDHDKVIADAEHHRYACEMVAKAHSVLLGRKTFELFESFWPHAEIHATLPPEMLQFARLINAKRKYVASHQPQVIGWKNCQSLQQVNHLTLQDYRGKKGKDLLVFGSPSLIRSMLTQHLIEELHLCVQPIHGGRGMSLFAKMPEAIIRSLKLIHCRPFNSGVVCMQYHCMGMYR